MKTDITSTLVKYTTYLFLTLGLTGVLLPIVSHIWYPGIASDSIGAGIIMAAVFGGIGSAFYMRRHEALKQLKIQQLKSEEPKPRRFDNSFKLSLESKTSCPRCHEVSFALGECKRCGYGHTSSWHTLGSIDELSHSLSGYENKRQTKQDLEQKIEDLEAKLAILAKDLDDVGKHD